MLSLNRQKCQRCQLCIFINEKLECANFFRQCGEDLVMALTLRSMFGHTIAATFLQGLRGKESFRDQTPAFL